MPYRFACDVIDEMRKMYETRNFSGYLGAVEEMQSMANRMEAKLREYKTAKENRTYGDEYDIDLNKKRQEIKDLNVKIEKEKQTLKDLKNDVNSLRHTWQKETKGGTAIPRIDCCSVGTVGMPCDCSKS